MATTLLELVEALAKRLGRLPTDDEVTQFIYGTDVERNAIWNSNTEIKEQENA